MGFTANAPCLRAIRGYCRRLPCECRTLADAEDVIHPDPKLPRDGLYVLRSVGTLSLRVSEALSRTLENQFAEEQRVRDELLK